MQGHKMFNIIIACSGSVATIKLSEILQKLQETNRFNIKVVLTQAVTSSIFRANISLNKNSKTSNKPTKSLKINRSGNGNKEETQSCILNSGNGQIFL